jgi:hypothetical protein
VVTFNDCNICNVVVIIVFFYRSKDLNQVPYDNGREYKTLNVRGSVVG